MNKKFLVLLSFIPMLLCFEAAPMEMENPSSNEVARGIKPEEIKQQLIQTKKLQHCLEATKEYDKTPLEIYAQKENIDMVKDLLALGADFSNLLFDPQLSYEIFKLFKNKITKNHLLFRDLKNNTPLHIHAKVGNTKIVGDLLALKLVPTSCPNWKNETPLQLAIKNEHKATMDEFFKTKNGIVDYRLAGESFDAFFYALENQKSSIVDHIYEHLIPTMWQFVYWATKKGYYAQLKKLFELKEKNPSMMWGEPERGHDSLVFAIDEIDNEHVDIAVFKDIACLLIENNCPYFPVQIHSGDSSWKADLLSYAVYAFIRASGNSERAAHSEIIDLLVKKGHKPLAHNFALSTYVMKKLFLN